MRFESYSRRHFYQDKEVTRIFDVCIIKKNCDSLILLQTIPFALKGMSQLYPLDYYKNHQNHKDGEYAVLMLARIAGQSIKFERELKTQDRWGIYKGHNE